MDESAAQTWKNLEKEMGIILSEDEEKVEGNDDDDDDITQMMDISLSDSDSDDSGSIDSDTDGESDSDTVIKSEGEEDEHKRVSKDKEIEGNTPCGLSPSQLQCDNGTTTTDPASLWCASSQLSDAPPGFGLRRIRSMYFFVFLCISFIILMKTIIRPSETDSIRLFYT